MNRRQAISSVALLLGGTIIGGEIFALTGCKSAPTQVNDLFTTDDVALLDEIAETIIPETNTPGAKAAETGAFMTVMVKDCYTAEDQQVFIKGLKDVNDKAQKNYSANFVDLKPKEKEELLNKLDVEQSEFQKSKEKGEPSHYFRMMKELTMLGFFTSEVGGTKVLTYLEVPGRYDACIDYKKGDPVYLSI
ncbi:MAG TPA: gluconate 2-dehydrogenase subunit 3 family protein [Pelobium sp.]|nr:gluconate 2-dehydrogenase subunit 3 family protein [Pelobium sp.]